MPISKIAFVRATLLLLAAGLATLLLVVATSLFLVERSQSYSEEIVAARQIRSAVADLLTLLQAAETGQRGYVITEEAAYLEPYVEARAGLEAALKRLADASRTDSGSGEEMPLLDRVVRAKFDELEQVVTLVRAGRRAEAIASIRQDGGKVLMDEARGLLDGLLRRADARLETRVAAQRSSATALKWVSILGAVVIIIVIGGSAWTVVNYTRQLAKARLELEALTHSLEERVRERTADLGRANDEIQRFAYIVSHDLRAPLVNIMGFTSELETSLESLRAYVEGLEDRPDDDSLREAKLTVSQDLPESIGFIRSSTRKMDGLINAILKLSREGRRTLKPERIDLDPLLRASANSVQHQLAEADGSIEVSVSAPTIMSDRLALEQIFGNLIDNAVKYRQRGRAPVIRVVARSDGPRGVVVSISDNGRGIAPQDHERVFELFRRAGSQDQSGEGIGLAHVRTLVRNLGGDISLQSEFGKGSTFSVKLPRDLRVAAGSPSS